MIKKIAAVLMSGIIIANLVACSGGTENASTPSSEPSSVVSDSSSQSTEQSSQENYGGDIAGTKGEAPEHPKTDSLWGAPQNYTIVYAEADAGMKALATKVQRWFSENYRCAIPITSDKSAEKELEILIGNTNRKESGKKADGSYKVSVQGDKLVFDGYHSAIVEVGVNKFLEKNPKKNEDLNGISGKISDFKTSMLGYDYVWGDEFATNEVDFSKWTFEAKMGEYADARITTDRDVIDMRADTLVLRSVKETDYSYRKYDYKMPTSVVSQRNMMFTYGYCEIKAKVPTAVATWPSFWMQSSTGVGERNCFNYFVEVDVFEIFGAGDAKLVPNLHKWYDSNRFNYGEIYNSKDNKGNYVNHTATGTTRSIKTNTIVKADAAYTYHTYGYEWTPTYISMYVDGVKYQTYDITKSWDLEKDMSGFHDPQFVIFNNHLFTDTADYIPTFSNGKQILIENNESSLSSEFIIDYYRLYQKKGQGKIWTDDAVYKTFMGR